MTLYNIVKSANGFLLLQAYVNVPIIAFIVICVFAVGGIVVALILLIDLFIRLAEGKKDDNTTSNKQNKKQYSKNERKHR